MTAAATPRPRGRQRSRQRLAPLAIALLLACLLPTLLLYVGAAASMALGASVAALAAIVAAGWPTGRRQSWAIAWPASALTLALLLVLALHLVAVSLLGLPLDALRAAASVVPLGLMIFGGRALAGLFASAAPADVGRVLRLLFWLFCVISVFGIAGLAPPAAILRGKPVFPFTEPSYFALGFVPLLMFQCVTSKGWQRVAYLVGGVVIALLLENLTLTAGCLLIAVICLRPAVSTGFIVVMALVASQVDTTYYADRLDLAGDGQNLSKLVYLQGWQLIVESVGNSRGLGLGFQQLGVHGTNVLAADLIEAILSESSNLLDGGFTVAKLLSEFGVFGLALTLGYLMLAARSLRALKRASAGPADTFANCTIIAYGLDLMVRGSGYFSTAGLLLVAACWMVAPKRRRARPRGARKSGLVAAGAPRALVPGSNGDGVPPAVA